jgi:pyruvate,water dikinase
MEIEAIKKVRNVFGLKNISLLIPFCRTLEEAKGVSEILVKTGLISAIFAKDRFEDDLKVYVMAEIPSNVILADQFLDYFDGMSIGSNDLTQLTLGLDRDNAKIAKVGDERNEAVKELIKKVIAVCHQRKKYSGICGEAPSYFLNFAQFLIKEGIQSISLNPDSLLKTLLHLGSQNFNEEKPQN